MTLPRSHWALLLALLFGTAAEAAADDWPQWRGPQRDGVWRETGILDKFPADGPRVAWRVAIGNGYSGPAVAAGRVYITEYERTGAGRGVERAICLNEHTGERIWTHEWPADYDGLGYDLGPRATPTVDGTHVYILGAAGDLLALKTADGSVAWHRNYQRDFAAELPTWGFTGAPLVDGNRLLLLVGGRPDAKAMALDKATGEELWRSLTTQEEPGYAPPMIFDAAGARQLIIWHADGVASLNPETGSVYWDEPFDLDLGMSVATPVFQGGRLFVSAFYNGSRLYKLDFDEPRVELLWKGNSNSEIDTDGLHALVTTPVLDGEYIYGVGSYGHLRALDAHSGKRLWESLDLTSERARWASAQIVRHGDRYFVNNDRGEFIIARFTPEGYEEIDRVELMTPTNPLRRRRERGAVQWTHPAYANRHMIIRNDEEIVRFSLAAE